MLGVFRTALPPPGSMHAASLPADAASALAEASAGSDEGDTSAGGTAPAFLQALIVPLEQVSMWPVVDPLCRVVSVFTANGKLLRYELSSLASAPSNGLKL